MPSHIYKLFLKLIKSLSISLQKRSPIPKGYVDVDRDGLFFFHAVVRQLQLIGHHYDALELQHMAIDEVLNNRDRYEGFVVENEDGLEAFLNYHLHRQESNKGGWADNIMIQALANALGYRIEVELFDLNGDAIGHAPPIVPRNHPEAPILRIGNIGNIHFVAADNGLIPVANNPVQPDEEGKNDDGAPTVISVSNSVPTSNATSQVYYETLEFGDASSFELSTALTLSGVDSVISSSH